MSPTDKRAAAVLALVGLLVVVLGSRGTAEFSAHMAMDISQRMPLGSLFARVYMAEGMDTVTFRPGSVVAMRALGLLGSPLDATLGFAKSLLVLPWLLAAFAWGRRRLGSVGGVVVALAPLLIPAGLFNAWHLGEWDLLGATLLLGADELLLRGRERRRLLLLAAALYIGALLLKDSIAIATLLMLGLASVRDLRDGRGWGTAPQLLMVGGAAALGVFFMHRTPWQELMAWFDDGSVTSMARGGPMEGRPGGIATVLQPLTVTLGQLGAMVGLAGALTALLGAFGRRLPGGLVLGLAVGGLLLPTPRWFHFYLCYVADSPIWVWTVGGLLLLGLAGMAWRGWRDDDESDLSALYVLAMTAAWLVLPIALSIRADVSTRVFLPAAPLLAAVFVGALRRIAEGGRAHRAAAWVLGVALAYGVVSDGARFSQRFLATEAMELEGKSALAAQLDGPGVLFPVNKTWQITDTELGALMGVSPPPLWMLRVPFPVDRPDATGALRHLEPGALPVVAGRSMDRLLADGRAVYSFSLLARSAAGPKGAAVLRSRYTGQPQGSLPDPWPIPLRTFDDDHFHEYSCCDPVDELFASVGGLPLIFESAQTVWLPPRRLEGLLPQLVAGAPLIERQDVVARLHRRGP
ncbi:MAG: hypothetical protein KDA24_24635 [Deltaproteobacteria bacterium]|nr:hypothetical protein [Deltaproteobacteria bacterium]